MLNNEQTEQLTVSVTINREQIKISYELVPSKELTFPLFMANLAEALLPELLEKLPNTRQIISVHYLEFVNHTYNDRLWYAAPAIMSDLRDALRTKLTEHLQLEAEPHLDKLLTQGAIAKLKP